MNLPTGTKTGLALPASRARGGYFAPKSGHDLAWGNLLLALMTPIGTRPMRRQWGSGLFRMVLDPPVPDDPAVRLVVRDAAARYAPDVRINRVGVRLTGTTLRLDVGFSLAGEPSSAGGYEQPVPAGDLA